MSRVSHTILAGKFSYAEYGLHYVKHRYKENPACRYIGLPGITGIILFCFMPQLNKMLAPDKTMWLHKITKLRIQR